MAQNISNLEYEEGGEKMEAFFFWHTGLVLDHEFEHHDQYPVQTALQLSGSNCQVYYLHSPKMFYQPYLQLWPQHQFFPDMPIETKILTISTISA